VTFTFATGLLLRASLRDGTVASVLTLAFGATAAALRVRRQRHARETGLLFEDHLPTDVTPLRLNAE
jgi:hypothetical protein